MSRGLKIEERHDVKIKRANQNRIAVSAIKWAPAGDPLEHERQHLFDPVHNQKDQKLVENILEFGYDPMWPIGLVERGRNNLVVNVGSRRTNACLVVEQRLRESGQLGDDEDFMVPFVLQTGTIEELLAMRLRENEGPLRVPNTISVLSSIFSRMAKLRVDKGLDEAAAFAEIAKDHPPYTPGWIGTLIRARSMQPEALKIFDAGELPVSVVEVVLTIDFAKQFETARMFADANVKSPQAARGLIRKLRGKQVSTSTGTGNTNAIKPFTQRVSTRLVDAMKDVAHNQQERLAAGVMAWFASAGQDTALLEELAPGLLERLMSAVEEAKKRPGKGAAVSASEDDDAGMDTDTDGDTDDGEKKGRRGRRARKDDK